MNAVKAERTGGLDEFGYVVDEDGLARKASLASVLLEKGDVRIDDFGTFELRRRKARRARNPRTGERIDVPARTVVYFKPAAALRDRAAQVNPDRSEG